MITLTKLENDSFLTLFQQINMEVSLNVEKIPILKEFVSHLTKVMHSSLPGSLVIWYAL